MEIEFGHVATLARAGKQFKRFVLGYSCEIDSLFNRRMQKVPSGKFCRADGFDDVNNAG